MQVQPTRGATPAAVLDMFGKLGNSRNAEYIPAIDFTDLEDYVKTNPTIVTPATSDMISAMAAAQRANPHLYPTSLEEAEAAAADNDDRMDTDGTNDR